MFSYKSFLALLLLIALVPVFSSCEEPVACRELMSRFCDGYGISALIYSPSVSEGEAGYFSEDMFYTMYSEAPDSVEDIALIMLSRSDAVGECAVIRCYSVYDALLVSDMCQRRMALFGAMLGEVDNSYAEDAFIMRRGTTVVMCALRDNEAAYAIWSEILR